MKKTLIALLITTLGGGGVFASGPFIALHNLSAALQDHDAQRLEETVDFPVLRENIKSQLNASMGKELGDLKDNPFGLLAAGFAATMVDGLVDAFLTPSGLQNLMQGQQPAGQGAPGEGGAGSEGNGSETAGFFDNATYRFDSPSRFSASITGDDGKVTRFVLFRKGLSWQLGNIVLPE